MVKAEKTVEREDNYEDAVELNKELQDVIQRKRDRVNSSESRETDSNTTIITGHVTGINKDVSSLKDKVGIEVSFYDGGEEITETFTLRRPTDPSDFTIDNEFVRFVNFFGSRKNDVTSVLEREVWVRKMGDNLYTLQIPESLDWKEPKKLKMKRGLASTRFVDWDDFNNANSQLRLTKDTILGGGLLSVSLLLLAGLFTEVSVGFFIANAFFGVILGFTALVIGLFAFTPMYESLLGDEKKAEKAYGATIGIVGIGVLAALYAGILDPVPVEQIPNDAETTLSNVVLPTAATAVAVVSSLCLFRPANVAIGKGKSAIASAKKRYRKWKGIEYVE